MRPNSSQKLSRPGAGPPAEPARQHASVGGGTLAAVSDSSNSTHSLRPSCRVGFGTWALAVQLRLKSLAGQTIREKRRTTDSYSGHFVVAFSMVSSDRYRCLFSPSHNATCGRPVHSEMRRVLISGMFSAVIVGASFVLDQVWTTAPPFLAVPIIPGLYCAGILFRLSGWQSFDLSGDFQSSFTVAMITFSLGWWLVLFYGAQLLARSCKSVARRIAARAAA